jgi:hypothetical protein
MTRAMWPPPGVFEEGLKLMAASTNTGHSRLKIQLLIKLQYNFAIL